MPQVTLPLNSFPARRRESEATVQQNAAVNMRLGRNGDGVLRGVRGMGGIGSGPFDWSLIDHGGPRICGGSASRHASLDEGARRIPAGRVAHASWGGKRRRRTGAATRAHEIGGSTDTNEVLAGQCAGADTVAGGLSRYGYVVGNPETMRDPSGHVMCVSVDTSNRGGGGLINAQARLEPVTRRAKSILLFVLLPLDPAMDPLKNWVAGMQAEMGSAVDQPLSRFAKCGYTTMGIRKVLASRCYQSDYSPFY